MENEGIEPNLIMSNVLVNAFGTAGSTWKLSLFIIILKKLYVYLIRAIKLLGYTPDVVTYSTLMKAFTRPKKYEKGNGSFWVYGRSESKTAIAKCFYGS
ncbi:putative protein [Arabidopsis thaliana]|uniref:Pentatricopeptide repeat (PPR) superfamily protein n=1 Tax=Arabidopsis thaliana TaxID=3702 RepID=Q9M2A8_ARATH|nr:Pentatricopeptide repeat (PPR) superfamily protein [Arabidopsis thaliana]AEE77738.1 Pentatricopeptide repeat (PPR) superfamily protein [Arabidopsis thaliana]CAB86439.1 putative protein [Arabidopsis thaliana]|eukprot:NP_189842.1 Pentatricopeptide repeat (PPR) superfamily protein [Arabidopsis thaliana]